MSANAVARTRRSRKGRRGPPEKQIVFLGSGDYRPFTGQGDYKSTLKKAAKAAVKLAMQPQARSAAVRLGRDPRGTLGTIARGALSGFMGNGDYSSAINNFNSLINPAPASVTGPRVSNAGRRGTRFQQSEFIGVVRAGAMGSGSTLFQNTSYVVNPGNPLLFPWLSQVAALFDQWRPDQIFIRYKSTSSEFNGASQALGTITAGADYDVADKPYASRIEIENSDHAISCKASDNLVFGLECDRSERPTEVLYTGSPPSGSSVSASFYNLARFQLATQGMSAAGVELGELWIDYDITFYKKQVVPSLGPAPTHFGRFISTGPLEDGESMAERMVADQTGIYPVTLETNGFFYYDGPSTRMMIMLRYESPGDFDHQFDLLADKSDIIVSGLDYEFVQHAKASGSVPEWVVTAVVHTDGSASFRLANSPTGMTGRRVVTMFPVPEGVKFSQG